MLRRSPPKLRGGATVDQADLWRHAIEALEGSLGGDFPR
jgi:hypothetical protein